MDINYVFDTNSFKSQKKNYSNKYRYFGDNKKSDEDEKLRQNNEQLKNEVKELELKLNKEKSEKQELYLKIKQLENDKSKMQKLLEENEKQIRDIKKEKLERNRNKDIIGQKNKELENQINQYKENEKNYKEENEKYAEKLKKLNDELEKMKKGSEFNTLEKENLSKDPLEFYNIIGNINSMQNVNTDGWDFYMNEEGYKIVESKEKTERLIIGVMGNRNKGKSFILQALSGAVLKTGTTINTIGISIKYLENKYVLLDCAGSESPLLGENANMLEISRDKLFTEAFLESYILRTSNVLLLVVGILSFSEQKLINKISKDLEKLKGNELKNLIVIHNLQTYEEVADVEKYINEILLKSASFNLKKDETNFSDENEKSEFFYDIDNTLVKHFIFAKENSPAGNKYNKNTIKSIKSLYTISTSKDVFDYKKSIIEHFKYMAEKMYDGSLESELKDVQENVGLNNENKDDKIINANDKEFDLIDKNYIKYSLKLKYEGKEKLSLQKMVIDELGISSFINNDFVPNYEMYYNDKELIINIESPEGTSLTAKRKKNKKGAEYPYCIELTAEKKEEPKKDNVTYIRAKQFGKFHTLIPFSDINYSIGQGKLDEKSTNGWQSFQFPLIKVEDDD